METSNFIGSEQDKLMSVIYHMSVLNDISGVLSMVDVITTGKYDCGDWDWLEEEFYKRRKCLKDSPLMMRLFIGFVAVVVHSRKRIENSYRVVNDIAELEAILGRTQRFEEQLTYIQKRGIDVRRENAMELSKCLGTEDNWKALQYKIRQINMNYDCLAEILEQIKQAERRLVELRNEWLYCHCKSGKHAKEKMRKKVIITLNISPKLTKMLEKIDKNREELLSYGIDLSTHSAAFEETRRKANAEYDSICAALTSFICS